MASHWPRFTQPRAGSGTPYLCGECPKACCPSALTPKTKTLTKSDDYFTWASPVRRLGCTSHGRCRGRLEVAPVANPRGSCRLSVRQPPKLVQNRNQEPSVHLAQK